MGKRKIGEINRKPIVIGDPNLISKNEVNVDNLSSGEGGGSISNIKYFKHNGAEMGKSMVVEMGVMAGQTIKWKDTDDTIRFEHGNSLARNVDATSLKTSQRYIGALAISLIDAPINIYINSAWMEQNFVEYISDVVKAGYLIEITKEEFYSLN